MPASTTTRLPLLARLNIHEGMAACWWRTFFPSLSLFLLTAAFIVTKTGRDALYFQAGGVADLPKAYLGIAILSVPAASGTLGLMKLFGPRRARVLSLILMAVLQLALYPLVHPGGGWSMTLFFVSIPVLYGVLLSLAWLLGADLLDDAPRFVLARLYSTMGASSMIGGFTGAAISRRLCNWVEPEAFVLAGAVFLLLGAIVNAIAHRQFPVAVSAENTGPMPSTPKGELPPDRQVFGLFREPYAAMLAVISMISSLVGVLIEFQFYWSAAASARDSHEALRTFSSFYLYLNGAAAIVQLFITPFVQQMVGVHRSLLILPAALVGASAIVAASASMFARAGLRITEGGLKSSVHRSNWEQAYLPLERRRRTTAKLLVDGVAARVGEGTAASLLLGSMTMVPSIGDAPWINGLLIGASIVWFGLTLTLTRLRNSPSLIPASAAELRPDLPIPDG